MSSSLFFPEFRTARKGKSNFRDEMWVSAAIAQTSNAEQENDDDNKSPKKKFNHAASAGGKAQGLEMIDENVENENKSDKSSTVEFVEEEDDKNSEMEESEFEEEDVFEYENLSLIHI